ncbi:NAD(P)/FAD-dependent oxidoreductase [Ramlibacter rhizophilus]|uniref:Pyridine nucleotide-disulfide oxidoreductase n=1 Tax=Ramlibacter rhizophilus TaxID=1781167 RepID=A0A4Z0BFL8_9BURK|nr:FAD-dependent oxidoreductase [Ramlibacter rhizophilus]TFY97481.1 pyridine nucleotide-disulfide oxidoreductase [Ramlibacter rhizophilus]
MTTGRVVIVGAGQSAAVAAHALREGGHGGAIVMAGRELHRPYERPPLSKAVLVGAEEPRLDVLAEEAWLRCNVELLSGADVVRMEPAQRRLHLANGQAIDYDQCLLATGGEPRLLAWAPCGGERIHYLRTLDDARRLRLSLQARPRIAIVGGGFLGLEVAHSALAAGASVTVIESAPALLTRFLPAEVSAWLEATLRSEGAQLRLGASVSCAETTGEGPLLLLTQGGERLEVDELLVCIGMSPNDALAREAGLAIAPGGGVLVDAFCRTSDAHVYACGDCASQLRPGQQQPTRMESWQNANEQARIAAAAMLGSAPPVPPYPWFWTEQGRHNLQMLGLPAADLVYVRRGDPASGKALWIGHRGGVPVHGVALNAGGELRALRPLFDRARPVPMHEFGQDNLNLRAWAKQSLADAAATP